MWKKCPPYYEFEKKRRTDGTKAKVMTIELWVLEQFETERRLNLLGDTSKIFKCTLWLIHSGYRMNLYIHIQNYQRYTNHFTTQELLYLHMHYSQLNQWYWACCTCIYPNLQCENEMSGLNKWHGFKQANTQTLSSTCTAWTCSEMLHKWFDEIKMWTDHITYEKLLLVQPKTHQCHSKTCMYMAQWTDENGKIRQRSSECEILITSPNLKT